MTNISVYKASLINLYGFVPTGEETKLPSVLQGKQVNWTYFKDVQVNHDTILIGVFGRDILNGIADRGFYVCPVSFTSQIFPDC